jgi:hypothetical protein
MWKLSLFNYRFSVKIIAFQRLSLYNKQKNTWVLGNTRFISRVEHDISLVRCAHSWDIMFNTRNKSGISAHPCIILYIIICCFYRKSLINRNMHYIEKNRDTLVSVIYVLNVNCQNNSLFQNISLFQYIIRNGLKYVHVEYCLQQKNYKCNIQE